MLLSILNQGPSNLKKCILSHHVSILWSEPLIDMYIYLWRALTLVIMRWTNRPTVILICSSAYHMGWTKCWTPKVKPESWVTFSRVITVINYHYSIYCKLKMDIINLVIKKVLSLMISPQLNVKCWKWDYDSSWGTLTHGWRCPTIAQCGKIFQTTISH